MSVAVQSTSLLCQQWHKVFSRTSQIKVGYEVLAKQMQQVQTSESARCQSHQLISKHV